MPTNDRSTPHPWAMDDRTQATQHLVREGGDAVTLCGLRMTTEVRPKDPVYDRRDGFNPAAHAPRYCPSCDAADKAIAAAEVTP